jgi:hypothetical protein
MVLTFPISSHSFSDGLAGTAPENRASVRMPRNKNPRCCNTKGDIRFCTFPPEKDYIRLCRYLTHSAPYNAEVKMSGPTLHLPQLAFMVWTRKTLRGVGI